MICFPLTVKVPGVGGLVRLIVGIVTPVTIDELLIGAPTFAFPTNEEVVANEFTWKLYTPVSVFGVDVSVPIVGSDNVLVVAPKTEWFSACVAVCNAVRSVLIVVTMLILDELVDCCAFHVFSGMRSAVIKLATKVCQSRPDAKPERDIPAIKV